jgi:hypothetical protein
VSKVATNKNEAGGGEHRCRVVGELDETVSAYAMHGPTCQVSKVKSDLFRQRLRPRRPILSFLRPATRITYFTNFLPMRTLQINWNEFTCWGFSSASPPWSHCCLAMVIRKDADELGSPTSQAADVLGCEVVMGVGRK